MRVVFRNVPEFLAELGKQPIEGKILRLTTRHEKTGTAKFLIRRVTIATCLIEGVGDLLKLSVQEEPEKAVAAQAGRGVRQATRAWTCAAASLTTASTKRLDRGRNREEGRAGTAARGGTTSWTNHDRLRSYARLRRRRRFRRRGQGRRHQRSGHFHPRRPGHQPGQPRRRAREDPQADGSEPVDGQRASREVQWRSPSMRLARQKVDWKITGPSGDETIWTCKGFWSKFKSMVPLDDVMTDEIEITWSGKPVLA